MIPRVHGRVGTPVLLKGTAYDFGHNVTAIEFSLDDGANWTRYDTPGTNDYQNLSWTFEWTPEEKGFYLLKVRSMNNEGKTSPESAHVEIAVE